jgi:hypothetical protein
MGAGLKSQKAITRTDLGWNTPRSLGPRVPRDDQMEPVPYALFQRSMLPLTARQCTPRTVIRDATGSPGRPQIVRPRGGCGAVAGPLRWPRMSPALAPHEPRIGGSIPVVLGRGPGPGHTPILMVSGSRSCAISGRAKRSVGADDDRRVRHRRVVGTPGRTSRTGAAWVASESAPWRTETRAPSTKKGGSSVECQPGTSAMAKSNDTTLWTESTNGVASAANNPYPRR